MASALSDPEFRKLTALARYAVIDTLPEELFDPLLVLTGQTFGVSQVQISFIDEEYGFFNTSRSQPAGQAGQAQPFYAQTSMAEEVLVVSDTALDPRFADLSPPTGERPVRFYAGAPLITSDGHRIGALGILDHRPRPELSDQQRQTLLGLASAVMGKLEDRLRIGELEREAAADRQQLESLRGLQHHGEVLGGLPELLLLDLPPTDVTTVVLELISRAAQVDWGNLSRIEDDESTIVAEWTGSELAGAFRTWFPKRHRRSQSLLWQALSSDRPTYTNEYHLYPGALPGLVRAGIRTVAMVPLGRYGEADYVVMFSRLPPHQEPWSPADRTLLVTAGRVIQVALAELDRRRLLALTKLTDPLTGFGSQHGFLDALAADRPQDRLRVAVVLARLVSDPPGGEGQPHHDALTRLFGSALAAELPEGIQVYRLAGAHFALLGELSAPADQWERDVLCALDAAVAVVRLAALAPTQASAGTAVGPEADTAQALYDLAERRLRIEQVSSGDSGRDRAAESAPAEADSEQRLTVVECGALTVDTHLNLARYLDARVDLQPREARLLALLADRPGEMISRQDLSQQVWGRPESDGGNMLNVYISGLRKKLALLAPEFQIQASRKAGYAMHVPFPAVGTIP